MRKIYSLLAVVFINIAAFSQVVLPIDFESGTITYNFSDFNGGAVTVISNPQSSGINTSSKVARMVKGPGGEVFGGSALSLNAPIDFSVNKLFKVKVYSPRVGAKLLLKVENQTNGAISFEKEATCTVANAWEELSFDYTDINTANSYQKLVFIFDLGTVGDGTANFTWLFDDIRLIQGAVVVRPTLPVDFESATIPYAFEDFAGGVATVINNPQSSGINTSAKIARMVKGPGGAVFGGSTLILSGPIDFSTNKVFKVKVYAPRIGAKLLLKVENLTNGAISAEREQATTVANAWEELSFDFSAINTANSYQKLVFIFDLGTVGDGTANFTFLFDDIRLVSGGPTLAQMDLPVTFENPLVDYGLLGFGGATGIVVTDPTLATNKVAQVTKSNTAADFAGVTLTGAAELGFVNKIPFSVGNTKMNVRVWSPNSGIKIRLKVEVAGDPTKSVETEVINTIASAWEPLEFNFSNQVSGTAAINFATNYNKATIFFNFGVPGATAGEKIYFFDDVQFGSIVTSIRNTELFNEQIKVYPNPVTDKLLINYKAGTSLIISLYNYSGKLLKSIISNSSFAEIDMKKYPSGTYIVRIEDKSKKLIGSKVIVK